MFRVGVMDGDQAALLKSQLIGVAGVVEAAVLAEEGVAMLKVKLAGWDEAGAKAILQPQARSRRASGSRIESAYAFRIFTGVMASINKVMLIGNLGKDPEYATCLAATQSPI